MFTKKYFLSGLIIFILLQLFYYVFLIAFHDIVPFNTYLYGTAFHYGNYSQQHNSNFNLLNALSAWDSQWYLRIAHAGYTSSQEVAAHAGKAFYDQYAYAFLPLYPLSIFFIDFFLHNTLASAFILNNIILIAIFFSSYYVISKLYSHEIAMRTNFLLLFFPLSVFYRSYYAESLFLLLLIWFGYTLVKRDWLFTSLLLYLLCLTKDNGIFLYLPLLYVIFNDIRHKKMHIFKAVAVVLFPLLAYAYLFLYGILLMGNGMVWVTAHAYWGYKATIVQTIGKNFQTIFTFFSLPLHVYKPSKTEVIAFFVGLFLLYKSRKFLKPEHWYIIIGLCIVPLLVKNFTSYARYEIVVFPFFIYLAKVLKGIWYDIAVIISFILLLIVSLVFINWGWVE